MDESPGPDIQEKNGKVGLDPKYLQPASSNNQNANNKGGVLNFFRHYYKLTAK